MTIAYPSVAGEWFNFRGIKKAEGIALNDILCQQFDYDDGMTEVVQLADAEQLQALQSVLAGQPHPPPPHYLNRTSDRKAGTWVNLRGAKGWRPGADILNSSDRIIVLEYEDGIRDAVLFSFEQAQDVTAKLQRLF